MNQFQEICSKYEIKIIEDKDMSTLYFIDNTYISIGKKSIYLKGAASRNIHSFSHNKYIDFNKDFYCVLKDEEYFNKEIDSSNSGACFNLHLKDDLLSKKLTFLFPVKEHYFKDHSLNFIHINEYITTQIEKMHKNEIIIY